MACRNVKVRGYTRKDCRAKGKSSKPKGKLHSVSREAAVRKSGPHAGKLKPGCRYTKRGAVCRKAA